MTRARVPSWRKRPLLGGMFSSQQQQPSERELLLKISQYASHTWARYPQESTPTQAKPLRIPPCRSTERCQRASPVSSGMALRLKLYCIIDEHKRASSTGSNCPPEPPEYLGVHPAPYEPLQSPAPSLNARHARTDENKGRKKTHQNLGVRRVFQYHREACHLVGASLQGGPVPRCADASHALARPCSKQRRFSEFYFSSSAPYGRGRFGVEGDTLHGATLRRCSGCW